MGDFVYLFCMCTLGYINAEVGERHPEESDGGTTSLYHHCQSNTPKLIFTGSIQKQRQVVLELPWELEMAI